MIRNWPSIESLLGRTLAVTLMLATWCAVWWGNHPVAAPSVAASVLLIVYTCIHRTRIVRWYGSLDWMTAAIFFIALAADISQGRDAVLTCLQTYGEWVLPFAAGRFAMLQTGAISKLSSWFLAVAVFVAIGAILESTTGWNVWEFIFGEVDDLVRSQGGSRLGWFRAHGPTRHPLFLSVILMLMLPWAAAVWESYQSQRHRIGVLFGVLVIVAGILATISRGPVIGLVIAASFVASVWSRPVRYVSLIGFACVALFCVTNFSKAVELIEQPFNPNERGTLVEVEGEAGVYTGTRSRIFLVKVFGPLVIKGGPLGYGTDATDSFPPTIPGLPTDDRIRKQLGIVDNSFILVGLRYGWLGAAWLAGMFIISIIECLKLRRIATTFFYPSGETFPVVLAGTLLGVAFEMTTVFLSYDYGFWVLFHFGVVSGLVASVKMSKRGELE